MTHETVVDIQKFSKRKKEKEKRKRCFLVASKTAIPRNGFANETQNLAVQL